MNQPDFRGSVTYSRGPLVRGILRGVWMPSLIVLGLLGGYVWYRYAQEKSKTILDVAMQMESRGQRDRWVAAFDLTKRLRADQPLDQKLKLYGMLGKWISRPEMYQDVMFMRYVAIVAAQLKVDPQWTVVRKLATHPDEAVRAASLTVILEDEKNVAANSEVVSAALADSSDNVRAQTLRLLSQVREVPARLHATVESLVGAPALDVNWNATLTVAQWDWPKVRDRLELLMDLNGTHFKSLGERALEDFERRTIDVMVVHRDDRVQTFLLKFYEETTNLKLKQYIAKYLSAGRSEG